MKPLELYAPEISAAADAHRDDYACRQLLFAVLHKTLRDLRHLRAYADSGQIDSNDKKRRRRIVEYSPIEFVEGEWFEEICDYLGLDAEWMRRELGGVPCVGGGLHRRPRGRTIPGDARAITSTCGERRWDWPATKQESKNE